MRLSISSSDDRLPQGEWFRPLIVAAVVTIALIVAWESKIRHQGFEPSIASDTKELWAQHRQRASALGEEAVILVGSSRMLLDINVGILAKHTSSYPVQLAIDGNSFWPVLKDLAEDDSITGTVIVDMRVQLIDPEQKPSTASLWVNYYHKKILSNQPYFWPIENKLRSFINSKLTYRSVGFNPQLVFFRWLKNERVSSFSIKVLSDRTVMLDYQKVDHQSIERRVAKYKKLMPVAFIKISDFDKRLSELETLVTRIHARGGRVIFLYLPTSGEIKHIDDVRFPRKVYWDRLVGKTAARTLHFEDLPELSGYELKDGSHLDYRQAISFTSALGSVLFSQSAKD